LITVAVPAYNGEKYLEDAVSSIISQTVAVDQIFIIDDASTDNTFLIANNLKQKYDRYTIHYTANKTNVGYQANWNKCFEYCKTPYLVILHQDDQLKEDTLESQLNYFKLHPEIAIVGGFEDFVNENGKIFKKKPEDKNTIFQKGQIYEFIVNHGVYIPCSSVMFHMPKIRNVGYFETDVIATDEMYWPKVLSRYPIAILGKSLIYRRAHPDQAEYRDFIKFENQAISIYEKFKKIAEYEERIAYRGEILKQLKFKFSRSWIMIASSTAKRGARKISLKYIGKAIRINPLIILRFPLMWKTFAKIILFFLGIKKVK